MSDRTRRLVVTADDLGLHRSINKGILAAHSSGVVTCASVVASGEAFDDACDILASAPSLQVAVHLTLVGGEKPICRPQDVPSLLDSDGRFLRDYLRFLRRYLARRIRSADVERELRAQIEVVLSAELSPVHLNAHQHLHLLPGIWEVVLRLAE